MTKQAIESGDLRVVFQWRGDRYGHAIEQRVAGVWQVVLDSVEGSPDEDWPPSPVLQSLHIEHRPEASVALLVGKAGTSHWSASVEPLRAQAGFQFDIACRVHEAPHRLGTTYQWTDRRTNPNVQISALSLEAACELVQQPESSVWQIRPAAVKRDYPSTIRWRYLISARQFPD